MVSDFSPGPRFSFLMFCIISREQSRITEHDGPPFILVLRGQRQACVCEFKASQGYIMRPYVFFFFFFARGGGFSDKVFL